MSRKAPRALLAAVLCVVGAGCSTFHVTQIDESPGERTITTKIAGSAWFTSAQNITAIKALQTDKTQSFGAGTFGQHGATNATEALNALARIAEAVKP
jgi:hypothetical protein